MIKSTQLPLILILQKGFTGSGKKGCMRGWNLSLDEVANYQHLIIIVIVFKSF